MLPTIKCDVEASAGRRAKKNKYGMMIQLKRILKGFMAKAGGVNAGGSARANRADAGGQKPQTEYGEN